MNVSVLQSSRKRFCVSAAYLEIQSRKSLDGKVQRPPKEKSQKSLLVPVTLVKVKTTTESFTLSCQKWMYSTVKPVYTGILYKPNFK